MIKNKWKLTKGYIIVQLLCLMRIIIYITTQCDTNNAMRSIDIVVTILCQNFSETERRHFIILSLNYRY